MRKGIFFYAMGFVVNLGVMVVNSGAFALGGVITGKAILSLKDGMGRNNRVCGVMAIGALLEGAVL